VKVFELARTAVINLEHVNIDTGGRQFAGIAFRVHDPRGFTRQIPFLVRAATRPVFPIKPAGVDQTVTRIKQVWS
jgi:hypothetical protein